MRRRSPSPRDSDRFKRRRLDDDSNDGQGHRSNNVFNTHSSVNNNEKSISHANGSTTQGNVVDEDEIKRQRREKLEQWRRQKLGKESDSSRPDSPVVPTEKSPSLSVKPLEKKIGFGMKLSSVPNTFKPSKLKATLDLGDDEEEIVQPVRRLPVDEPEQKPDEDVVMDDDEDPLEQYMNDVKDQVTKIVSEGRARIKEVPVDDVGVNEGEAVVKPDEDEEDIQEEDLLALAQKVAKRKDLQPVDHDSISYEPFKKDFYIEPPEIASLTDPEVDLIRSDLDGIKIRGILCPRPVVKWTQFGLPTAALEVIKRVFKYEKPTPIQAQAIPAIMSGRDVIGVAKTGSGKTIAFLLPLFRHIKAQRPLETGEGPIALIMTPTRELAVQIFNECKHFAKPLNIRVVCAYGGSPIGDQISDLKRGAEVVVCTPGRMIDLLCANNGRVTNLERVTYMVLDEADRMFDMGFEPQVMKILRNVRPDRQTVLFSATFPRAMEALARKVLKKPLEITVGGRSVVASDITQYVEVLPSDESKFLRLLKILGNWQDSDANHRALIFVDKQESADSLLRDLLRRGYPCQSLHGGKEQIDRDSTIQDFKSGDTDILIATSVAARGLDVKNLDLVINYDCPNHMEDYVHRVGRTGRAGNKGTAYTFITPAQEKYSVDLVKALKMSNANVPEDLQNLADEFLKKVKAGDAKLHGSGFGGKGLEKLEQLRDQQKRIEKQLHGTEEEEEEEELPLPPMKSSNAEVQDTIKETKEPKEVKETKDVAPVKSKNASVQDAIRAAQAKAAALNSALGTTTVKPKERRDPIPTNLNQPVKAEVLAPHWLEIEINDYPQKARWKVTSREQLALITESTGAAVTTRGTFYPAGQEPNKGDRKLHLLVEGDTEASVEQARQQLLRILKEAILATADERGPGQVARYSVV